MTRRVSVLLVGEHSRKAFQPGKIHSRRKGRCDRNCRNPHQPKADAHLVPGIAPGGDRQKQGGSRHVPLLGFEAVCLDPPCAVSVPNLMTDRPFLVIGERDSGNVRRLMYQPLIWPDAAGNKARGLAATLDSKHLQRATNALIDGMRRDSELGSDFLGGKMVVDEPKAAELSST